MDREQVLEGTREELKLHDEELSGKRFRLVPLSPDYDKIALPRSKSNGSAAQRPSVQAKRQLTGMGTFAGIIPSSEDFMRQKQEEIELEDGKFRRWISRWMRLRWWRI